MTPSSPLFLPGWLWVGILRELLPSTDAPHEAPEATPRGPGLPRSSLPPSASHLTPSGFLGVSHHPKSPSHFPASLPLALTFSSLRPPSLPSAALLLPGGYCLQAFISFYSQRHFPSVPNSQILHTEPRDTMPWPGPPPLPAGTLHIGPPQWTFDLQRPSGEKG